MEEITDWRTWIKDLPPADKRNLSTHLDVHITALSKWVQRHRSPRADHLHGLVIYNPALRASLAREYPDVFNDEGVGVVMPQITADFYQDILATLAYTAFAITGQTIATKVFESMCSQLDPAETGLLIMPTLLLADLLPEDAPITIMHTGDGYCVGIFKCPKENEYYEIGRDSLSGIAVSRRRVVLYPLTGILAQCPAYPSDKIVSAAAFPLWRRGNLAGALLVASVHRDFFTASYVELCTRYSDLYALSLYDAQFYDPRRIDLRVLREEIEIPEPNGAS